MYDYILEEMADAIAKEFRLDNNEVLGILNHYWQDKIAHVWQVDDMLECARRAGKPITHTDAAGLLHNAFAHHDSSLGISWTSLEAELELENYRFALKTWPEEKYNEIYGVFVVWQKGNPIAHQFGSFPHKLDGNLPEALEFAKMMAKENPGQPVLVGCEPMFGEQPIPWLTILTSNAETEPVIEESEAICTPSSPDNASAS
jgi:hypothetical protein